MAPLRPAARMQPVEVLDEDLAVARVLPDGRPRRSPGPPPDPGDGQPRVRALARWWPAALALVLVLGALAAVGAHRDRVRAARLAAVPGVVRPLDRAPTLLWSAPAVPGDQVLVARGQLVVVSADAAVWRATARDARTGTVRWVADVAPVTVAAMEAGPVRCPDPGVDVGAVLVCVAAEPSPVYADDPDGTVASGQVRAFVGGSVEVPRTRVVALGATDGRALGSWTLSGELVASGRVADDVLVATVDPEGYVLVERRDAATGSVVWHRRGPTPVRGATVRELTSVRVTRELVVVAGSATHVLDARDGSELVAAPDFTFLRVEPLRAGFGTWSPVRGGSVHDASGAVSAALPGLPAPLALDDGSEPGLVVLDGGNDVTAYDSRTGEEVWRTDTRLDPELLVDHRLVVAGGSRYGVLDARTGEQLWDEELGAPLPWRPLTDGVLVIGPTTGTDGRTELVGRGLPDGVRYWSVGVPEDTRRVRAVAGRLLLTTSAEHRVLG